MVFFIMVQKKRKIPLALKVIQTVFPVLEQVAPDMAGNLGVKLFVRPFRFPYPKQEQEWLGKARRFSFEVMGKQVQGYRWGKGRPAVLMHGWSGRATQLYLFIQPLIDRGFEVIALDATGHGKSSGKTSNLIEFTRGLEQLIETLDEAPVFIGHSLGGAAGYLGMSEKRFSIHRMVSIATPTIGADIITEFLYRIKGRPSTGKYLDQYVLNRFGNDFNYYSSMAAAERMPNNTVPTLIVHGDKDRESPLAHSQVLHEALPASTLAVIPDVGHTRILKDINVVERIVDFVASDAQELGISGKEKELAQR